MSKKNRRQFNSSVPSQPATPSNDLAGEYKIIRHDLIRVLIVNVIFLAGVLTLYYTNRSSGYLERWFASLLNF